MIGQTISRYDIMEKLRGICGPYKAEDVRLGPGAANFFVLTAVRR